MKLEHLTNREPISVETVAAGETIENVQIRPVGDFPNGDREQHCTLEALENVARQWKEDGEKEILVDFEHNSEAGGTSDTSAAAWVTNLRVDGELGLVGDFKLTDVGAEAISNRRLRFLSVAWLVNKTTREPMVIRSIALTNKPNIPVAPVLNRECINKPLHPLTSTQSFNAQTNVTESLAFTSSGLISGADPPTHPISQSIPETISSSVQL